MATREGARAEMASTRRGVTDIEEKELSARSVKECLLQGLSCEPLFLLLRRAIHSPQSPLTPSTCDKHHHPHTPPSHTPSHFTLKHTLTHTTLTHHPHTPPSHTPPSHTTLTHTTLAHPHTHPHTQVPPQSTEGDVEALRSAISEVRTVVAVPVMQSQLGFGPASLVSPRKII